jgi:signal transduction histidine kinase
MNGDTDGFRRGLGKAVGFTRADRRPTRLRGCDGGRSGGVHQLSRQPAVAGVRLRSRFRFDLAHPPAISGAGLDTHLARDLCVLRAAVPPIGLALPIAAALFSAAEAGRLRISVIVSLVLVGLAVYFQIAGGRDIGQLLGYELPPVIALMGASLALGDGARSRRLLKESQRERDRQARLELERRATEQRNEERLRLARDLHDALGHNVAMISLQSAVAAEALPTRVPEAQRAVAEIRNVSVATMAELRNTVRSLRSLDSAVERLVGLDELPELAEQARGNGLDVRIVDTGESREVPRALGQAIYRVVQEALTNIIRHANATTALVTLDRGPDALTITVRDDGQGATELSAGNGIRGMSERAAEWGGQLNVTSPSPGAGTVVTAVLPWPQSAEAESDT